jgi:DUF4097 and DUF4098 domain-containing protein YvlB
MRKFDMNINLSIIRSIRMSALIGTTMLMATQVLAADNQFTERFDFEPGQTLSLDLSVGGSIKVEGWDQAGIEVTYGDKQTSLDHYKIDIENVAGGLSVDANALKRISQSSLFFEFKAPREMILDLYTAGGSVELSGLKGEFSGKTSGGALRLDDLTGQVDLRTGGGRILVQNSTLDGEVRTGGGKVLVENVTGDIQASSGGGTVTYRKVYGNDGNILSPNKSKLEDASEETVLISNAGGKIKVEAAPEGADVYTGGGNIRVKGADRFVSARTGGGDIEIDLLAGWVKAGTGAGEIEVFVADNAAHNGDISLTSGTGDILLTLPADFSMDLSVELGVTNNSNDKYTLNSDFDIDIETDDEWDYSRGTPRKYTIGSANLNGGNHRVIIHTTNGNVTIKKSN